MQYPNAALLFSILATACTPAPKGAPQPGPTHIAISSVATKAAGARLTYKSGDCMAFYVLTVNDSNTTVPYAGELTLTSNSDSGQFYKDLNCQQRITSFNTDGYADNVIYYKDDKGNSSSCTVADKSNALKSATAQVGS